MKANNLSLKTIALEKIVNVVSDSTAHGIKNVFKSSNWFVKIFWLVMFLTSSCVAVYCKFSFLFQETLKITQTEYKLINLLYKDCLQSFFTYIQYPVSVTVSSVREISNFPAITICKICVQLYKLGLLLQILKKSSWAYIHVSLFK